MSGNLRRSMHSYLRAFPDLKIDVRAAVTWILRGKHHGELMNIPATGRRVEVSGTTLLTIKEGRIQAAQRSASMTGQIENC